MLRRGSAPQWPVACARRVFAGVARSRRRRIEAGNCGIGRNNRRRRRYRESRRGRDRSAGSRRCSGLDDGHVRPDRRARARRRNSRHRIGAGLRSGPVAEDIRRQRLRIAERAAKRGTGNASPSGRGDRGRLVERGRCPTYRDGCLRFVQSCCHHVGSNRWTGAGY